ncbi:MAG: hypothetical protein HFJ12_01635 [Bacilli bacterium]|nr:hypothetical protein [Bacilli bacterium]
MTIDEFYKNHIGKGVDLDKSYGVQCVDLFKCFTSEFYGISNYNCGNGFASGLWYNRKSRPYYEHFEEVSINNLQNGDWCFWANRSKECPDSHVAMYYNGQFFGQNQGKKEATLKSISKSGMLGALRPKMPHKIGYKSHVQNLGWQDWKFDGETSGTTGQSKRLEAIQIDFDKDVYAKAHIQDIGWKDYGKISKNTIIGTTGKGLRLEDLCLKGDFEYRVHVAQVGWTGWTKADGVATLGTVGQGLSIEAIQIR